MMAEPIRVQWFEGTDAVLRLTRLPGHEAEPELPQHIIDRNTEIFGEVLSASQIVSRILADVRENGDEAIRKYTRLYDGREPEAIVVPKEEWHAALNCIDSDLREALRLAANRIRAFHQRQKEESWFYTDDLGMFGQIIRPLQRVGVYTPAGSAALPSSLMMTAIPAQVAGVEEVIVATPPGRDGRIADSILAAAAIVGVDAVLAIGGAQAIGALAYGTESVPCVGKICGPGNVFVALAKQQVMNTVAIDQIAGPTETMVIADESADPELVTADLIAQAEHDPLASAILVTTSNDLANKVLDQLPVQAEALSRTAIIRQSLEANGVIAVVDDLDAAVACGNAYAPEHLCLHVADPWSLVPMVHNAGGIFVGENSPEALGDYTFGPSHVMPTSGTARFSSPTNVRDFQKVISLAAGNNNALRHLGDATVRIAQAEGLDGHAASITRRLDKLN